jgi:hypothetical protein
MSIQVHDGRDASRPTGRPTLALAALAVFVVVGFALTLVGAYAVAQSLGGVPATVTPEFAASIVFGTLAAVVAVLGTRAATRRTRPGA